MEKLTSENWTHYLYIIRFVDGRFYTGVSKRKGDNPLTDGYFGSPLDRSVWDTVMYEKEIIAYLWCKSHEEAYGIEAEWQKKCYEVNDTFCLNKHFGSTNFSEEAAKQGGKTQGQRNVKNGTGLFRPDIVARRNAGEFKSKPNPNQVAEMQRKGWESNSKEVILTHIATGKQTTYPSLHAAARDIGGSPGALCHVIKGERKTHLGFTAQYIG
jgi:hypothetical protein